MKLGGGGSLRAGREVAPSRGRGLKRVRDPGNAGYRGRPFTGAWIETHGEQAKCQASRGRPFTGAWIETAPVR